MADTKLRCEPFVDDDGRAQPSDTMTDTEKVRVPGAVEAKASDQQSDRAKDPEGRVLLTDRSGGTRKVILDFSFHQASAASGSGCEGRSWDRDAIAHYDDAKARRVTNATR